MKDSQGEIKKAETEKLEKLLLERLYSNTEREFDIADIRAELAKRLKEKK